MFDHLEYSVASIKTARRFYGAICQAIGGKEIFFDEADKAVGFGKEPIVHLLLSEGPATRPKLHLCFSAASKASVDKAYTDALAAGGCCNGKPGYRDRYDGGYYAAFLHDADGHNVEILFREPD